jgi:hypothetical protein
LLRYDVGNIDEKDSAFLKREQQAKPGARASLPLVPLKRKQAAKFAKAARSDQKKVVAKYLKERKSAGQKPQGQSRKRKRKD